jgi:sensor c-di-GMP phosphodiesterase-like protein
MAKSLKLKVIAEGVENEAQMSFLRAHHCDEIQGYYFSKPLAVEKVADKLRGDNPGAARPSTFKWGTIMTEDNIKVCAS